jgi:hypothetical protein
MSNERNKAIETQVMTMMRDGGHLNQFNARFLSDVAVVIQDNDFDSLKPTRDLRK